jgi:coproporphyrinogen III oxidase
MGVSKNSLKNEVTTYIKSLQNTITKALEKEDGKAIFKEDKWVRPAGGGGITRVIENGNVFEKGGVNTSEVFGNLPKSMQTYLNVTDNKFFACGLSLVLHPKNPFVPTVHANWRYFELYNSEGAVVNSWFGGGLDLTPYYLFEEDARHFHTVCKNVCDVFDTSFYPKFKKQCDTYFYNTHREEARGIGGLFFDYLKTTEKMTMKDWFLFVSEVGNNFLEAYLPIVEKRKNTPFNKAQRAWQEIRRGRYVEFNLIHDKGTSFGLKTNGRIESILMSLPPVTQWRYNHQPEKGSEEEKLLKILKNPQQWV